MLNRISLDPSTWGHQDRREHRRWHPQIQQTLFDYFQQRQHCRQGVFTSQYPPPALFWLIISMNSDHPYVCWSGQARSDLGKAGSSRSFSTDLHCWSLSLFHWKLDLIRWRRLHFNWRLGWLLVLNFHETSRRLTIYEHFTWLCGRIPCHLHHFSFPGSRAQRREERSGRQKNSLPGCIIMLSSGGMLPFLLAMPLIFYWLKGCLI